MKLNTHDLEFILKQIEIAEAHAAGTPLIDLVDSPLLPYGLRTVDGSYNNLVPGRELWGASGQPFPRLTTPSYRNEGDDALKFGTPANPVWLTNNNYGSTGGAPGPGQLAPGTVVDADPRIISNLIVDQTLDNPAAIAAALRHAGVPDSGFAPIITEIQDAHTILKAIPVSSPAHALAKADLDALLEQHGVEMSGPSIVLPNVAPDEGLSASYNSWFTLFGQFFDHGLDLVAKGDNGTVYIPLQPDDPLYDAASPHTNFMAMTRVSIGDAAANVTTPWVDQNQTYTSHPSHQVFLREYVLDADGKPVATGNLLDGGPGRLATWADVKEQARDMLGIELTDADVHAVPLIRTDPYGKFIPDPDTGFAQVVTGLGPDGIPNTADDVVISGTPSAPASLAAALRTSSAFLNDIAHAAVPVLAGGVLQPDADDAVGYTGGVDTRGNQTSYDDEVLDAHYITGDGRGNENIGLTAVHFVFHAEHNRLVEHTKDVVLASGNLAFINEWLTQDLAAGTDLPTTGAAIEALKTVLDQAGAWDGERLFQAARFTTEMQYQHLVFEEFARKVQPDIDVFMVQPDVELNPAIFAEFAHVVYRFGHSMLNETVDRIAADGTRSDLTLFEAFLNPLAFGSETVDHHVAAGAIIRGMTAQVGNEIDEFTTNVLRNQLVGIPLDLAAINIARGRDTGMPSLNEARAQFKALAGGDTQLDPYLSWADFALNLKNPESIINFIAAYGTHGSITGAETIQGKRDAAMALVFGGEGAPADRLAFLNATGSYAVRKGGLDDVDLWVGGLAEKKMPFGGMLGSTFAFIFEMQMENLQDSDRFYYLSRTQGLNLLTELENNSLAKIVMRNTDLGETGFALPGDIFSTPDHVLYVDQAKQLQMTEQADPTHDNPTLEAFSNLVERGPDYLRYNGVDHVVIMGSDGNDHIVAGGGDDTVWGGAGNDRLEAGYGVDKIMGGAGDDIITNAGTDIGETDMLHGDDGNDVIHGGSGLALIFGGTGNDFLMTGPDGSEIRGGMDDDFLLGDDGADALFGNEGHDWIEGKDGFEYIAGDNGDLFFNSTIIGHDVMNGGSGDTDYDADSGDDIMVAGEGIQKFIGMWGHDWVVYKGQEGNADADMNVEVFQTLPLEVLRDRFSQVEAVSGWNNDDVIRGDDRTADEEGEGAVADPTPEGNFMYNELDEAGIARIDGLDQIITTDLLRTGSYWADGSGALKPIFTGGNILLGGAGSDTIEGRGGDDVIDGDRWLNIRISIRDDAGLELATVDSLSDVITNAHLSVADWNGRSLPSLMLSREIEPLQFNIVREILDGEETGDIDTAVYWDVAENYAITRNADGSVTVEHVTQAAGAIDPETGRNRVSDGTDRLFNIEKLKFADGEFSIGQLLNRAPTGQPAVSDTSPTEGTAIVASIGTVQDPDGIDLASLTYQWEVLTGGTWTVINGATSASFTPTQAEVDKPLRVAVSFTDTFGTVETMRSEPTIAVGDLFIGTALEDAFNGTDGDDVASGFGGADNLMGGLGNDILDGGIGADELDGGDGDDVLLGGVGNDHLTGGAGDDLLDGGSNFDVAYFAGGASNYAFSSIGTDLTVADTVGTAGTDTLRGIERLNFDGVAYTVRLGTDGSDPNLIGTPVTNTSTFGRDAIFGFAGDDVINAGSGDDIVVAGHGADAINGGAGNDIVQAGAGADTITQVGSTGGRDLVDGGEGEDTYVLNGSAGPETFTIYTRAAALGAIPGLVLAIGTEIVIARDGVVIAELDNIEEIRVNTLNVTTPGGAAGGTSGGDTIQVVGDFEGTSLNFNTITIDGGEGADTVDISALQSAHRIVFRSNGGNDTIVGTLRAQDVIELPEGATPDDYEITTDENGVTTMTNGDHSLQFVSEGGLPQFGSGDDHHADDEDDDDDIIGGGDDDDDTNCGCDEDEDGTGTPGPTPLPSTGGALRTGTALSDVLIGTAGADNIIGLAGDDVLIGEGGDDAISAGEGGDFINAGSGRDMVFAGAGDDQVFGGAGADMLYGEAGDDRLFGDAGNDLIDAGAGNDTVVAGAGDDLIVGAVGDGNDTYFGDDSDGGIGNDTLDLSAITANLTVDLGNGLLGRGSAFSMQSGTDTLWNIENVATGSGSDTITANNAVNVIEGGAGDDTFRFLNAEAADGDTILDFEPGDRLDLSGIDANTALAGNQSFTLVSGPDFTASAQLMVTYETRADGDYTVVKGNVDAGTNEDFRIELKGSHTLNGGNSML